MEQKRYRILLVEDNELDRRAFERFVEKNAMPYDCATADSVSQAKQVLGSGQFDAVISDHSLGDGTAFDILNLIKNAPVIVITGAGDEETAVNVWKAGAYDYLIKDLDRNYLKAIPITVENAIKHKIVEQKLQLLSGAVMSTDDSVYITDMLDKVIFVNKAFCQTYGYNEKEIIGKSSNVLWIGKNQIQNTRSVFQTQAAGSTWEVGFYHKRKDDSVFPVSLSRSIIKGSDGSDIATVAVARDISEHILIEDEFRTTNLKLKKRNQLQNEVAITVSEALQRLLADGNVDAAKRVISDYHDTLEINAGTLELNRQQFDFAALASQIVETFLSAAAEKNVELRSSVPNRELIINGDYDRMEQVLTSLLRMAIESSGPNGHISLQVTNVGNDISVQMQDESPAFERNEMHRIVNRPDWIKEQFDAGREDLALGLRITKEIVEMHGGRIWAESSDTERNVLCFTVPKSGVHQQIPVGVPSATTQ